MDWLMKEGYGGAFIWTLDFDDFTGKFCGKGKYPIMSAINSKLAGSAPPIVVCILLTILLEDIFAILMFSQF